MNENIDNMFEDLEKEFPKNVCQKFVLRIYDNNGNEYFEDYEFKEKLFSNLFINYRGNALEIIKDQYNVFDINTDSKILSKKIMKEGTDLRNFFASCL